MATVAIMSKPSKDLYPRPNFERANLNWESLNGSWEFLFDDEDIGLTQLWQKDRLPSHAPASGDAKLNAKRTIQVPYVFQTPASGINESGVHEVLWYERSIEDIRSKEEKQEKYRLLLRFGAVDYHARVWIDGEYVGEHRGGHVPFDLDVTGALLREMDGKYRLTVRVFDSAHSLTQPRGKQFWGPNPESIFYTPSSGIWQCVWLESVPGMKIADSSHGTMLRSNEIEAGHIDARIAVNDRRTRQQCSIELEASIAGVVVSKSNRKDLPKAEDFVRFNHNVRLTEELIQQLPQDFLQQAPEDDDSCWRNGVALWSPEHPLLYDLAIRLFNSSDSVVDEVRLTTGMRSINWTTGDGTLRLNGRPYFHALLLDQGYWPDTLMTPPSQEALKLDIELSKKMGFNGCRKHQKVEDPVFMYWADKLGFLVWGEMANAYRFSVDYIDRFNQEWMEMVRRDINHPCVVAWTPVNESWGYGQLGDNMRQRDHLRSLYHVTKTTDPSRPINDNCGWEHVVTDLSTFHDYGGAPGMAERCTSIQSILGRGKNMFLGQIHGPNGEYDEGSKHLRGAPILCTEFGGVNIAASNDSSRKTNWGYTTAKDSQDLLKRIERIIMATVEKGHVCGIVWTQLLVHIVAY